MKDADSSFTPSIGSRLEREREHWRRLQKRAKQFRHQRPPGGELEVENPVEEGAGPLTRFLSSRSKDKQK